MQRIKHIHCVQKATVRIDRKKRRTVGRGNKTDRTRFTAGRVEPTGVNSFAAFASKGPDIHQIFVGNDPGRRKEQNGQQTSQAKNAQRPYTFSGKGLDIRAKGSVMIALSSSVYLMPFMVGAARVPPTAPASPAITRLKIE